jgi:hypothetical protein
LAAATLVIEAAYIFFRHQHDVNVRRGQLEQAVDDETRRAERLVAEAYRTHIDDLRVELSRYIDGFVDRRQEDAERLICENEQASRRTESEQAERRRALGADIRRARALRDEAQGLLERQ